MRFVRLLAAMAALAFSGQAQAAKIFTLSGTIVPDAQGNAKAGMAVSLPPITTPFARGFRFSFSRPVSGWAGSWAGQVWWVEDKFGNRIMGNDEDWDAAAFLSQSRAGVVVRSSPLGSSGPPLFWHGFVSLTGTETIYLDLNNVAGPVDYEITAFSAAPEPATWAMMIFGFGAIGVALRKRREAARYVTSVPLCAKATLP